MDFTNKVGFAIGTGRCGTVFIAQLLEREPGVASSHERNPDNEAFHRYCQWHGLPVDHEGFLATKEDEIREDLSRHAYSFEASPYLGMSVRELHGRFGCRFVLIVRQPHEVVTSFAKKGFYRVPYRVADPALATGYQDQRTGRVHNFFARIAPRGEEFLAWNAMSQVGKVAWFWRAWTERTLEALAGVPQEYWRIVRIEDFDYAMYRDVARFLGYDSRLSQADFDALRESKPHSYANKRPVEQWSEQEGREFEQQVAGLAERFGYEYRFEELVRRARARKASAPPEPPAKAEGPQFWRLRRGAASWLHGLADGLDVK